MELFWINYEESLYLFDGEQYENKDYTLSDVTPDMVAKRVTKLIRKYSRRVTNS